MAWKSHVIKRPALCNAVKKVEPSAEGNNSFYGIAAKRASKAKVIWYF